MRFQPLLTLEISHSYYIDGRCPDFEIIPYPCTQQWLRNQRGVMRVLPDRVTLSVPVKAENTPLIALPKSFTLKFGLYLRNPEFALYTNNPLPQPFFYRNWKGVSNLLPFSRTRPDPEAKSLPPNPFAQVRLIHKKGLTAEPARYKLAFNARSLRWAYLIVTDSNNAEYNITAGDVTFNPQNSLGNQPMSIGAVATALAKGNAGKRVVCLTSNKPFACQQAIRKSIILQTDSTAIIKNLPSPKLNSIANLNNEIILYEVIKVFSKPTNP